MKDIIDMDKKKIIERKELIKFISNENLQLPVYSISDSETPDFILKMIGKEISIEHTRLIKPKLQQTEKYKERIIENAQKMFEEKYPLEKLYVMITFNNIPLNDGKSIQEKYTNEIFALVEKLYLNNKEFNFWLSTKMSKKSITSTIESIDIDNTQNFSCWQSFDSFIVDWIDTDWLKNIIQKKENNIKKYKRKFDEDWLLLVADLGSKASSHRIDFIDFSSIQSKFDKIYLYQYRADEVTTIK